MARHTSLTEALDAFETNPCKQTFVDVTSHPDYSGLPHVFRLGQVLWCLEDNEVHNYVQNVQLVRIEN